MLLHDYQIMIVLYRILKIMSYLNYETNKKIFLDISLDEKNFLKHLINRYISEWNIYIILFEMVRRCDI